MKGTKIISILFIVIIWWSIWSALDMISEDISEDYDIDYYWIYGITFVFSMIIILFFNIE
jgi:TRAP-type C4-dicarboxylate transport system permease small subunit